MKTLLALFLTTLLLFACSSSVGDKVSCGSLDVYYDDDVDKSSATAVCDYLFGIGYGLDEEGEKIKLKKNEDEVIVQFAVSDSELGLEGIYRRYGNSISTEALGGIPVRVELCDDSFNTLKTISRE